MAMGRYLPVLEVNAMKCPVDGATLLMSERRDVEIDYCPECRGIWLDRGELDVIIERTQASGPVGRDEDVRRDGEIGGHGDDHSHHDRDGNQSARRKGRFSMLTDLLGGAED
jgi:Zn-finger nucleic acid-binding protein